MTPAQLRQIIQQMVDKTCEAHIRLVIGRLDNILNMCEREGGIARAREIFGLYKNIYGEPIQPEPVITLLRKGANPLDGRCKPLSEEHKAKIRAAKAGNGTAARNAKIIEMVNQGHPRDRIARQFGLTPSRISQIYIREEKYNGKTP